MCGYTLSQGYCVLLFHHCGKHLAETSKEMDLFQFVSLGIPSTMARKSGIREAPSMVVRM